MQAMTPKEREDRYARLLLEVGVNLQRGQHLLLSAEPIGREFLQRLCHRAYEMGAGYVHVEMQDAEVEKVRLQFAEGCSLDYTPPWGAQRQRTMVDEGWAQLSLYTPEDMDVYKDIEPVRMERRQKALQQSQKINRDACAAAHIPWCRAALPTPAWAHRIFPNKESNLAEEALWEIFVRMLRLDLSDPAAFWKSQAEVLKQRCEALNTWRVKTLHFRGEGTDLKVECLPRSRWIGGGVETPLGVKFMPNLPTEEVFTTPDYRKTEGRAQVVKPVEVLGISVQKAWFEFERGKVVRYGAESGVEALERFFDLCPQAHYLGEVALVDQRSPLAQSSVVFHSILYDENAASHIALGNSYPIALVGGADSSKSQLLDAGANVSRVHVDFMIGAEDMEVEAYLENGERVPVIGNGEFAPALQ